ncbi:hypothetical protein BTUL_0117g00410 [Botrytis tulipae]|uniref:CBM1 domain-containing protein n=1 Tax=Botrytis tulipae TaxID=87230 RepID=A0A4Z1EFC1_9HELO|nr:hypothetical protein BTUL_0117g00410 [Botrytis tulipae]
MKIFATALIVTSLFAIGMAQVGPCLNQADPDGGIGNYCYCEGDGLCYFEGTGTNGCAPPSSDQYPC